MARTTGACHHARLIFVFLVETGFHHIGQSGLELLTSGDPPTSASHSAEITGVSYGTLPVCFYISSILNFFTGKVLVCPQSHKFLSLSLSVCVCVCVCVYLCVCVCVYIYVCVCV